MRTSHLVPLSKIISLIDLQITLRWLCQMRTRITHKYVYRTFPKGGFNQLHKELSQYCNTTPPDGKISLSRKEGTCKIDIDATKEDLENICEETTCIDLSFHYKSNHMYLILDTPSKTLEVSYLIYDSLEAAKKFIAYFELISGLKRLSQQEVKELTDGHSCETIDSLSLNNESTNSLATVWQKALKKLQLDLSSSATYQTWIAPIVPSVEANQLILNCPSEFAKDWIESRYKKDIIEAVRAIDSSVEEVIVRAGGKAVQSQESQKKTNERRFLEIDVPLFEIMKQVYERDTENSVGCSFDKYFNQVIELHCKERADNQSMLCYTHSNLGANDKVEGMKSLFGILSQDASLEQAREERLSKHERSIKGEMDFYRRGR